MRHVYLCEYKFLWHEFITVKSRFAHTKTVEIKDLCLQLKRPGTAYAGQKIKFLISTVVNGDPLPL